MWNESQPPRIIRAEWGPYETFFQHLFNCKISHLKFSDGAGFYCPKAWNIKTRSTIMIFECGPKNKLMNVDEFLPCEYKFFIDVRCAEVYSWVINYDLSFSSGFQDPVQATTNMAKQSPKIPPHLKTYRVRINHDCQGNDIQRGISLEGNDHRACEELCRGNDNCVGYTWHGRTSNWSECWLKNKMSNCKPKDPGTCNKGRIPTVKLKIPGKASR